MARKSNRRRGYDEEDYDEDIDEEYDGYEDDEEEEEPKKSRRKVRGGKSHDRDKGKRKKRAIILFSVEIVVLLVLLFGAYTLFVRMNVTSVGKTTLNVVTTSSAEQTQDVGKIELAENTIIVNETVAQSQAMKGYRNIALFGVDSREKQLDKNTRSDTIIIASINQDNGEIRLVSVYRDTYLNLSNDTYNKCNTAYAKGGPAQAISMLNMNLDLDISDFVTVGFSGLRDTIDALGGVEVDVEPAVVTHLNNYQISMVGKKSGTNAAGEDNFVATAGKDYTPVKNGGLQTLDGLQATAYCRVRYVGDDFARAERQRRVLTAVLAKAKTASLSTLETIAGNVFKETYTSLDLGEIIELLGGIATYRVVGDEGFPVEEHRKTGNMGTKFGSCVLPMDLKSNVEWLHGFLFEDDKYEVTEDVTKYSEKIAADVAKNLR